MDSLSQTAVSFLRSFKRINNHKGEVMYRVEVRIGTFDPSLRDVIRGLTKMGMIYRIGGDGHQVTYQLTPSGERSLGYNKATPQKPEPAPPPAIMAERRLIIRKRT